MPGMATEQPRQPVLRKPLAPAADKRIVAVELVANLRPAMTRLQQQDQPRSAPVVCPTAAARRPLVQLRLFCFCQCDPALHEHDRTTFLRVTHHPVGLEEHDGACDDPNRALLATLGTD